VITIDTNTVHYLAFQVHHQVVDGEGAKQLFNLFAEIYRSLEKDPAWMPESLPDMNRSWGQIMRYLKWYQFLALPLIHAKETFKMLRFIFGTKKTTSVIRGNFPGHTESVFPINPFFETTVVKGSALVRLKTEYARCNTKLNDLLMAALMTTVSKWNRLYGEAHSHTTSVYTANLRRWWGQPTGQFANMSIIRMIRIKTGEAVTVRQALRRVKSWIDKEKKTFGIRELGDFLMLKIQPELITRKLGELMGGLSKEMHGLTNIGVIPESAGDFGRVKAVSYSLLAPPLASPSVIFTVSSYNNRLTVHGNFNGIHFEAETAKHFMSQFKRNLLAFAGPSRVSAPEYSAFDLPLTELPAVDSVQEVPEEAAWPDGT